MAGNFHTGDDSATTIHIECDSIRNQCGSKMEENCLQNIGRVSSFLSKYSNKTNLLPNLNRDESYFFQLPSLDKVRNKGKIDI